MRLSKRQRLATVMPSPQRPGRQVRETVVKTCASIERGRIGSSLGDGQGDEDTCPMRVEHGSLQTNAQELNERLQWRPGLPCRSKVNTETAQLDRCSLLYWVLLIMRVGHTPCPSAHYALQRISQLFQRQ